MIQLWPILDTILTFTQSDYYLFTYYMVQSPS